MNEERGIAERLDELLASTQAYHVARLACCMSVPPGQGLTNAAQLLEDARKVIERRSSGGSDGLE